MPRQPTETDLGPLIDMITKSSLYDKTGYHVVVKERMVKYGQVQTGSIVEAFELIGGGIELFATTGTIRIPSIARIKATPQEADVFVLEKGIIKTAVRLQKIRNSFAPSSQDDDNHKDNELERLSQPLASIMIGKTISAVQATSSIDSENIPGYRITFTDGTNVVLKADILDFDFPVITFE